MNSFDGLSAVLSAPAMALNALHRIFTAEPSRHHTPLPDHFLDDSEMEREMHHL